MLFLPLYHTNGPTIKLSFFRRTWKVRAIIYTYFIIISPNFIDINIYYYYYYCNINHHHRHHHHHHHHRWIVRICINKNQHIKPTVGWVLMPLMYWRAVCLQLCLAIHWRLHHNDTPDRLLWPSSELGGGGCNGRYGWHLLEDGTSDSRNLRPTLQQGDDGSLWAEPKEARWTLPKLHFSPNLIKVQELRFTQRWLRGIISSDIQNGPGGKSIFWEVMCSVILSKKVHIYMYSISKSFRNRAISLYRRATRHVLTRIAKCADVDGGIFENVLY
jgi:hypothetical protein